jgi:hypothetical protein
MKFLKEIIFVLSCVLIIILEKILGYDEMDFSREIVFVLCCIIITIFEKNMKYIWEYFFECIFVRPKIVVLTGSFDERTTFGRMFKEYLEEKGKRVWLSPSISELIKEENAILKRGEKYLFVLSMLLNKYEKIMNDIFKRAHEYDYILFNGTHIDTVIGESYINNETQLTYLKRRRDAIDFDVSKIYNVIYFKPEVEKLKEAECTCEYDNDNWYFMYTYEKYEEMISGMYPKYVIYEECNDFSHYE